MKKIAKSMCILLSFALIWNSASYLSYAQEDTTGDSAGSIENGNTGDSSDAGKDSSEAAKEPEEPGDSSSDVAEEGLSDISKDVSVDTEYMKELTVAADLSKKAFVLRWEKVADYKGCEVASYKNIDRSDADPLLIDVTEKIEDVEASEAEEKENVQQLVLDEACAGEAFSAGTVYYIDVKPYKDLDDGAKEYGKTMHAAAVLLEAPVASVTAGDTKCEVKWATVAGATKYEVYSAGSNKVLRTVDTNSATITGLKNSAEYKYQVRAIAELKATEEEDAEEFTYASELSGAAAGTPKIATPAKVSGLTIEPYNLGAILKWTKVSNATSYEIYRYDTKTKKWSKIKTVTGTTYKNTGLTNGRKYTYKVRAIRSAGGKTATGSYSSTVSLTAKKYLTESVHPMYYYARVKSSTPLYKASTGSASAGKLKAGTYVKVLKRARGAGGRCYVVINGKGYWLTRKKLNFYNCKYTTLDYTKSVKEQYVNSSGYSSSSNYLIWISSYTQKVNIFKGSKGKWKLYKTYACTTGRPSAATPQGTYAINKKISQYGGSVYEKYLSCFYGLTSFHSRLYRNGKIVDARIGQPVSGGCMRMYTSEAQFIYNNMPKGTTVVSN